MSVMGRERVKGAGWWSVLFSHTHSPHFTHTHSLLAATIVAAAGLPFRRGDEPLLLVTAADAALARRGEPALASLRRALRAGGRALPAGVDVGADDDDADDASDGGGGPPDAAASAAAAAPPRGETASALSVAMLATLRAHLADAYGLTPDRVAEYASSADRRKVEERASVVSRGSPLSLAALPPAALATPPPPPDDGAWWNLGVAALVAARGAMDAAAVAPPLPPPCGAERDAFLLVRVQRRRGRHARRVACGAHTRHSGWAGRAWCGRVAWPWPWARARAQTACRVVQRRVERGRDERVREREGCVGVSLLCV